MMNRVSVILLFALSKIRLLHTMLPILSEYHTNSQSQGQRPQYAHRYPSLEIHIHHLHDLARIISIRVSENTSATIKQKQDKTETAPLYHYIVSIIQ